MGKEEMARIAPVSKAQANEEVGVLYDGINKSAGMVPNIFQHIGNSPIVLKEFLSMQEAANKVSLSPQIREQIALTVGQANDCHYCLSAHTLIGGKLGLQVDQIISARKAEASDPKTKAILRFSKKVVESRAKVSDEDVSQLKAAGVSDKEIVEIIYVINVNMFTNYFNHIVNTPIDFPRAPDL